MIDSEFLLQMRAPLGAFRKPAGSNDKTTIYFWK